MSQRSTRRRLRVEQKALRHSVRGAVHLSMRRVLGMHRSSTTSALEPSASAISLCQSSSFGHAQSCTGCLASPQFVRSRNRSGEPRHDHPHELASRIQRRRLASSMPTRVREQSQSPADADETPHCLQLHRTVPGTSRCGVVGSCPPRFDSGLMYFDANDHSRHSGRAHPSAFGGGSSGGAREIFSGQGSSPTRAVKACTPLQWPPAKLGC